MFRGHYMMMLLLAAALVAMAAAQTEPSADSGFQVPEVAFQALSPKGLRVIMPALPGIRMFNFIAKISSTEEGMESGSLEGDVTEIKEGRLIFEDLSITLKRGNVIHYRLSVQHDRRDYRKGTRTFRITELVPFDTPAPSASELISLSSCTPSLTTVKGVPQVCLEQLLFEDNFSSGNLDPAKWLIEKRLSSNQQEYEFVSYQEKSVSVLSNTLQITPLLQSNEPGFDDNRMLTGRLDLTQGCSALSNELCLHDSEHRREPIPPVISGKISTKNSFAFKYGKVEIKAKLPQGDWVFPELYLEPALNRYGITGYDSGIMRIAFARGNLNLQTATEPLGNNALYGGAVLSQFEPCRSNTLKKNPNLNVPWGNDFHVYGLLWDENSIKLSVDGLEYGTIYAPTVGFTKYDSACQTINASNWKYGGRLAPFDEEFYISLGLGVGGVSDFPDNVGQKRWKNKGTKNRKAFWHDQTNWFNTWSSNTRLIVDYVKVWAL